MFYDLLEKDSNDDDAIIKYFSDIIEQKNQEIEKLHEIPPVPPQIQEV
jgi:hypothetical protein